MKSSVVMMLLTAALGIQSVSAFQGSSGAARTTSLKSTDDLYTPSYAPTNEQRISASNTKKTRSLADNDPILVQGGSLRTWSYRAPLVEKVQIVLSTEGRPSTRTLSSGMVPTIHLARCASMWRTVSSVHSAP